MKLTANIMKSLKFILILALSLGLTSCVDGQFYRSVRGNGNVVTKERQSRYFDAVRVATGIDVYLTQGDRESIRVEADENLHEYIVTEVRDGILRVYTNNVNIRDAEMKRVHVTIKDVKSLESSSAGDIIGQSPVKSGNVQIEASSSGDIILELYAAEVEVGISSAGNINLKGEAEKLSADLSSAGDLDAYDFKVKEADVSVSSAGSAKINVSESLKARASSAGDIMYMGNPGYVDSHSSSAGGVHRR
jgi:hypothetical protein